MTDGQELQLGRRERRKQQTRSALLTGAISLFREHGIYGTRIADITALADVGKGVFYNYFDSKEALVAELVREGIEILEREFLSSLGPTVPLPERIEELARLHEAFFEKYPDYALVIHQGRGLLLLGGTSDHVLRSAFQDYLARIGRWLPPAQDRDSWSQDDLVDVAAAIGGAVAGDRSFRVAAGLPLERSAMGSILASGIPALLERRRRR